MIRNVKKEVITYLSCYLFNYQSKEAEKIFSTLVHKITDKTLTAFILKCLHSVMLVPSFFLIADSKQFMLVGTLIIESFVSLTGASTPCFW